jgi:hypothetical protein
MNVLAITFDSHSVPRETHLCSLQSSTPSIRIHNKYRLLLHCGSIPGRDNDRIFLFATESRPALGPIQPPIQWILGAISREVKLPERAAIPPFPHTSSWRGA